MPDFNQAAFIFPGQGAQKVGMGKDLFDGFEAVKKGIPGS